MGVAKRPEGRRTAAVEGLGKNWLGYRYRGWYGGVGMGGRLAGGGLLEYSLKNVGNLAI